eukprot:185588-Chlamydomonas_euryale.AAC.1
MSSDSMGVGGLSSHMTSLDPSSHFTLTHRRMQRLQQRLAARRGASVGTVDRGAQQRHDCNCCLMEQHVGGVAASVQRGRMREHDGEAGGWCSSM